MTAKVNHLYLFSINPSGEGCFLRTGPGIDCWRKKGHNECNNTFREMRTCAASKWRDDGNGKRQHRSHAEQKASEDYKSPQAHS